MVLKEYVVKQGHFKGKKKNYYKGEVLGEPELYKERLPYFVKIGMLAEVPIVVDVVVEAPKAETAKPKKGKKSAKDSDIF